MKKSMTRSGLASEAVRRPKQPQKNLLEKIRMVSQSSVNEFQEVISILFYQRVSGGYLNLLSSSLNAKYPKETAPPMAAAGLLGPDLVKRDTMKFPQGLFVKKVHFYGVFLEKEVLKPSRLSPKKVSLSNHNACITRGRHSNEDWMLVNIQNIFLNPRLATDSQLLSHISHPLVYHSLTTLLSPLTQKNAAASF